MLSATMLSSGYCGSARDDLAAVSPAVRESLTAPRRPLDRPGEAEERARRERLEAEARNSFKIVVVTGCAWNLADGSTFAVRPGDVLVATGAQEGNYVFTHRNTNFQIPFAYARQSPFTEEDLAARRRELQRMYDSRDQIRELQAQTELLDSIQIQLMHLR